MYVVLLLLQIDCVMFVTSSGLRCVYVYYEMPYACYTFVPLRSLHVCYVCSITSPFARRETETNIGPPTHPIAARKTN